MYAVAQLHPPGHLPGGGVCRWQPLPPAFPFPGVRACCGISRVNQKPDFRGIPDERTVNDQRALFFTLFPSIMLPMFIAVGDQTIVASALPAIAADLGGVERVSWVVICYLISTTIAAPIYGRLADAFGIKCLMIAGICIFMAASLLCARSDSVEMLSLARVIQGLGGGGLIALSQALIGASVPPRQRGRYQGYIAAVAAVANAIGPVAGGFLTQHFGWQAIFLVNLPLGALAIVLSLRLDVPPVRRRRERFDFGGLLLLSSFVVCMTVVLQEAPGASLAGRPAWLAGAALLFLAGLVWHERRATSPLFPHILFREPSIWRANLLAVFHGAMLVSLITYLPIYIRVTYPVSTAQIGLLLLPMTVGIGIGSVVTGRLISRFGRTALMPSVGMVVVLFALLFLYGFSHRLAAWQLSLLMGLITAFMGTVMAVVQITVQTIAGRELVGTAAASVQFSKSLGSALGVAVVGGILFATLAAVHSETATVFAAILQHGPDALAGLPEARRLVVQPDIRNAFSYGFMTIAVFAAAAVALAWSIPMRRV